MISRSCELALHAFHRAAASVPAYQQLLAEAGIQTSDITTDDAFKRLPVLDKQNTFSRFPIADLCVNRDLGTLASVQTSSGHGGVFAFGLNDTQSASTVAEWTDDLLDCVFEVRSRSTLLVNCLPMGVRIHTTACTLAETSVRADMVVGLIRAFGAHYSQMILCGDPGFMKHVLELGQHSGIDWKSYLVHIALGEEVLAENTRIYFEGILGSDSRRHDRGLVCSSMGIGEIGMHLFTEGPPTRPIIALRRALHANEALRKSMIGETGWVPSLFTYDPRRLFVEFDSSERLLLTTLDPRIRCPLIRYSSGDRGRFLEIPVHLEAEIGRLGIPCASLQSVPIIMIDGRGKHATSRGLGVYPEAVKEGIYRDHSLARRTTANFRIISDRECARIRIQLVPGVNGSAQLDAAFAREISEFVRAPITVACESYESFRSGMSLDYERKFDYLGP